ncbi:MAG: TrkH family potassium uptake protein, partial [Cellulomonadaceae bacterium]|nr:TrkH family potassium uptake protein [Cellulomonadaceae bacterium]
MEVPRPLALAREAVDDAARQSPARLAVSVFAGVVGIFTALLLSPLATADGRQAPFADALFTAASAVCVTGLTTVPPSYWSGFGQAVILVGIKVGGLGVMTLASLLGIAVSRRIGLTQRLLTASETRTTRLGEVGSLLRIVILTSTTLEVVIALTLLPRFLALGETIGTAAWHATFYAVSAFNNAGFVPTDAGLSAHTSDWWLGLPIVVGVFIGSLGFPVILNIAARRRTAHRWSPHRWSLHTKLTLLTSTVLVGAGAVAIGALEWNNPSTLGGLGTSGKLLAALFGGVMPRSGGFA